MISTTIYSDPEVLYFDPPVALYGADDASRTYKFCSRYDNGADDRDCPPASNPRRLWARRYRRPR